MARPAAADPLPARQRRSWLRPAIGLVLTIVCAWLALRGVRLADVTLALSQTRSLPLLTALGLEVAIFWAIAVRWQRLFVAPHVPSLGRLFQALNIAQLANAMLPAKTGPLVRTFLIGEGQSEGIARTVTTIAGEKVVEGLSLMLVAAALVPFVPVASWLRVSTMVVAGLLLVAMVIMITLALRQGDASRWLDRLLGRWPRLRRLAQLSLAALAPWRHAPTVVALWAWSAVIWGLTILLNQLLLWALQVQVPPAASVAILVFSQVGIRLPSSPGSLGVLHYLSVVALSLFGVDKSLALSYGLLLHLVTYLPSMLLGLLFLARSGYSLRRLRQSADRQEWAA